MIELPERIQLAELYGDRHACRGIADRLTYAWRMGTGKRLPEIEREHAAIIRAILRGDVVPVGVMYSDTPTVYVAEIEGNLDSLYVFECEDDRDEWAKARGVNLIDGDTGACPVIGRKLAAEMIAEERDEG